MSELTGVKFTVIHLFNGYWGRLRVKSCRADWWNPTFFIKNSIIESLKQLTVNRIFVSSIQKFIHGWKMFWKLQKHGIYSCLSMLSSTKYLNSLKPFRISGKLKKMINWNLNILLPLIILKFCQNMKILCSWRKFMRLKKFISRSLRF